MSWKPPSADARFENWSVEEDHELLGTVADEDSPALYDADTDRVFRGQVDPDAEHLTPNTEAALDEAEESLGEFLERVGEETGWDSLSEFAQDHLEDERE